MSETVSPIQRSNECAIGRYDSPRSSGTTPSISVMPRPVSASERKLVMTPFGVPVLPDV